MTEQFELITLDEYVKDYQSLEESLLMTISMFMELQKLHKQHLLHGYINCRGVLVLFDADQRQPVKLVLPAIIPCESSKGRAYINADEIQIISKFNKAPEVSIQCFTCEESDVFCGASIAYYLFTGAVYRPHKYFDVAEADVTAQIMDNNSITAPIAQQLSAGLCVCLRNDYLYRPTARGAAALFAGIFYELIIGKR